MGLLPSRRASTRFRDVDPLATDAPVARSSPWTETTSPCIGGTTDRRSTSSLRRGGDRATHRQLTGVPTRVG
jgi:hypothetical protein